MSDHSPSNAQPLGEISMEPSKMDQFMDNHGKKLLAAAIIIALAAGAYIIYYRIGKDAEHDAGVALSQADDLAAFQKIVTEYPKTSAAGSAKLLLADKQWAEGQQDPAIATLRDFIATAKDHSALPTAQASLGSKLASQGKTEEAATVFQQLADNDSARFLAPFALLSLGDIAKSSGDLQKAEAFYQRAQNEFPDSTFGTTAIRRLALLKAKPPVEIEPPPAPPAATGSPMPADPAAPLLPASPSSAAPPALESGVAPAPPAPAPKP